MKKQASNRSGLLLMEIIIAILFFSVISAICLQLFVKSHTLSRDTEVLDSAVNETSSAAELLHSTEDAESALREYYPALKKEDSRWYIYYDEAFKACAETDAVYYMEIKKESVENGIFEYKLTVNKSGSSSHIYEMEYVTYEPLKP